MTPNEQKAYKWEKEFDKLNILEINVKEMDAEGDYTYSYHPESPEFIKSFIASQIAQARADERRRIEKLINEAYLCCGQDSKDCPRKAELLSLINKE